MGWFVRGIDFRVAGLGSREGLSWSKNEVLLISDKSAINIYSLDLLGAF